MIAFFQILDYLKPFGRVDSLKLVVDKITSVSKGLAYIEYPTPEDAEYFMLKNYRNGGYYLEIEGYYVELEYTRGLNEAKTQIYRDWRCPSCNGTNFARRVVCYQCQAPKPDNPESCIISVDDPKEPDEVPCPVLSIRGLGSQTTKQRLLEVFQRFPNIKDVRVVWDKFRNESKGFGFIEFYSTEDATYALNQCSGLVIDEHLAKISYCKSGGLKKGQPPQNPMNSNIYDQTQQMWTQYSGSTSVQSQASAFLASITEPKVSLGIPNEEDYAYDQTSGYYYNTNLKLYYDPNSRYFYDPEKQQYCYYNSETQSYIPYVADSTNSTAATTTPQTTEVAQEKKKKKVSSNLIGSKKVSKEIGKWNAKSKELKEDIISLKVKSTSKPTIMIKKLITDSVTNDEDPETKTEETLSPTETNITTLEQLSLNFVPAASNASPENNNNNDAPLETAQDNICHLCKRKFPSNEALIKHKQLSELHKRNLELQKVKEEFKQKEKKNEQERRNRELQDIADSLKTYSSSIAEKSDLGDHNVGSKLLKKMGWQEGVGLGKSKSGITAPIQVEMRTERSGLGSDNGYEKEANVRPGDNYREVAKKKARARFAALMDDNPDSKRIKRDL